MADEHPVPPKLPALTREDLVRGLFLYSATSVIAVLGVALGHRLLTPATHSLSVRGDLIGAFCNWDGRWYNEVASRGYSYDPTQRSNVAFFPAYPLLGRWLAQSTGLRTDLALLIVSHASLVGAFVVLAAYLRQRLDANSAEVTTYALLLFALLPTTFFFRMAYSESLFVLTSLLTLYGMERRWSLFLLAVIIGFATATRPVGVALILPLVLYIWQTSPSWRSILLKTITAVPISAWGIMAYMGYQYLEFAEPLAFAKIQTHWRQQPPIPLGERVLALLALEPIWNIFGQERIVLKEYFDPSPLYRLVVVNRVAFVVAVGLLVVGIHKKWLNLYEVALAIPLVLIPYATRGYEMNLACMGRYMTPIVPLYLVGGRILDCMPRYAVSALLGLCAFLLGFYASLFAAWYLVY